MGTCEHDELIFDRVVCACGMMHYYCLSCGEQMEECKWHI